MLGINKKNTKKQCPIIVLDIHTTSPGQTETILFREAVNDKEKPSVKRLSDMYQHAVNIYRRSRNGRRRAGGVI